MSCCQNEMLCFLFVGCWYIFFAPDQTQRLCEDSQCSYSPVVMNRGCFLWLSIKRILAFKANLSDSKSKSFSPLCTDVRQSYRKKSITEDEYIPIALFVLLSGLTEKSSHFCRFGKTDFSFRALFGQQNRTV